MVGNAAPRSASSRGAGARPRWAAVAVFLLLTLRFAFRDNVTSNELNTLMAARQLADPAFLPGDWFLSLADAPRIPFYVLMFPLVRAAPLVVVSIAGRMLGYLLQSAALTRVALRLRLDLAEVIVVGGLYVWLDQSIGFGEWMFGQIESKVLAYGLVWLGLDALLSRSPRALRRAGLWFGLATTFHVLVGGWASVALGLTVVALGLGTARERVIALAGWALAAAPGLGIALAALTEPAVARGANDIDVTWMFVYLRNPHHTDPASIRMPLREILAAPVLLAALVVKALARSSRRDEGRAPRERRAPDDAPRRLAVFALMSQLPCLLGLVASRLPGGYRLLQLYPFRVGSAMLPMVGLAVLVPAAVRRLPEPLRRWAPRAGAAWVSALAAVGLVHGLRGLRDFPDGGRLPGPISEARSFAEACAWIRDHTPPGAVLLASPSQESVAYLSHRPVAVLFKLAPSTKATLAEWYRRMVDFNGGPFTTRGYAMLSEIDDRFRRHPREKYLALAAAYHGRYLLVRRRSDLDLPELYRNADWSVFDVRGGGPAPAAGAGGDGAAGPGEAPSGARSRPPRAPPTGG